MIRAMTRPSGGAVLSSVDDALTCCLGKALLALSECNCREV
jgi:hypothetical protein